MPNWDPRAQKVLHTLRAAGHRAVLVGGCVRDSLLGIPPHDYDAATSALPDEIRAACSAFSCLDTGAKHGTVTVLSDGLPVEVTTFRRESGYSDHRRPDRVDFTSSLTEDLARRDFTINAMAWDENGLADPFQGREDLQKRLIRCVGDPDTRLEEDALRVIRGLRLAAQLRFSIHPDTAAAIRRHVPQLALVAQERICTEFTRLLCSPGAEEVLLAFPAAAAQIVPELAPAIGFDQRSPYHIYDVYTHSVKAMAHVPCLPALRLAALLHDVGKPTSFVLGEDGNGHFYGHEKAGVQLADAALRRLRLDNATREEVLFLIERHHLPVEASSKWAGRWLSRFGKERFFHLLALKKADGAACAPQPDAERQLDQAEKLAWELLQTSPCIRLNQLAVNGRDAMAAGLTGPAIGTALNFLLSRVAEGDLPNDRDVLLRELNPK